MVCWRVFSVVTICVAVGAHGIWKKQNTPPHCTQVTKDTDYVSKYKYDYPFGYIPQGQHEAYQQGFDGGTQLKSSSLDLGNASASHSIPLEEPAHDLYGNLRMFQLYCLNPPMVHKAVTTVCDWAAPPQVQFTLGDEFMHVVRQDPTGRFLGNAVITTYQFCSHNNSHVTAEFIVTKLEN